MKEKLKKKERGGVRNNTQELLRSDSPCRSAVTQTHPTFLLSRYGDSLVLSLWDQFSLLQVRSLALLLHVPNDRIFHFGTCGYALKTDSVVTCRLWLGMGHSLKICGTVRLHELLFGSQEDVGFKPENREAELTVCLCLHVSRRPPDVLCTYLTS